MSKNRKATNQSSAGTTGDNRRRFIKVAVTGLIGAQAEGAYGSSPQAKRQISKRKKPASSEAFKKRAKADFQGLVERIKSKWSFNGVTDVGDIYKWLEANPDAKAGEKHAIPTHHAENDTWQVGDNVFKHFNVEVNRIELIHNAKGVGFRIVGRVERDSTGKRHVPHHRYGPDGKRPVARVESVDYSSSSSMSSSSGWGDIGPDWVPRARRTRRA